jgi:ATP-dependent DNA helicase RecG
MPALPINIANLLRQRTVESERIEFKAGWNPDAIIRTLCAFANDFENLGGGYVVIGQDCDAQGRALHPPVGVADDQVDKIQQELLAACQQIRPPYFPTLTIHDMQDRTLIVLQAPGGMRRPYKAPSSVSSKHKSWHYYIRRYSSTVEAKGELEQELLRLTSVPFDDRPAREALVSDLSKPLMLDYLREVGSALADDGDKLSLESLGRQMNLVCGPPESPWPKNVALMFFSEAPDRFFPYTQIDVVWFPEGAGGDYFEEKIFKGPLGHITREALTYIQRNFLHQVIQKHPDRAEATRVWNFPYAAIEEVLVNAVYHRSYEEREPVEVRITRDEIAILNCPGPDRSIPYGDWMAGKGVSRRYRNRRIGEFLKELDLTEGRSTGFPKLLKAMQANGSPPPLFETDEDRCACLVRLPAHPLVLLSTPEVTMEVTMEVTTEVRRAVKLLVGDTTRQQLQKALGLKNNDHFRKAYLLPAIKAGLIQMTQPDKPRSSSQRYRLTAAGKQLQKILAIKDN